MLVKFVQYLNAEPPIVIIDSGRIISVNGVSLKAAPPYRFNRIR